MEKEIESKIMSLLKKIGAGLVIIGGFIAMIIFKDKVDESEPELDEVSDKLNTTTETLNNEINAAKKEREEKIEEIEEDFKDKLASVDDKQEEIIDRISPDIAKPGETDGWDVV